MKKIIAAAAASLFCATAGAQTSGPVKISGAMDLSGAAADVGQDSLAGAKYAVEQINRQGGVLGRKVELDYKDSGSNPQRAISVANALVNNGPAMLLAPQSSATALAVSKAVTAKRKIPTCVGTSIVDDITMKDFNPYVYSVTPTSFMEARAQGARFAKKPYKRYALLSADYAGGRSGVNRFREELLKLNPQAKIVVEEYPKFGARDYTASINKLLAAKPDYVFSILFGSDLLTFSRQASALGFFKSIDNKFLALYDFNTLKALGSSAPIGTDGWERAPANYLSRQSPAAKKLIDDYKARHGGYPSDWTLLTYDCVMNWAQAANAAKSIAPDAVMKQIEQGTFDSPRGAYRFGSYDHEAEAPIYFGKVAQSKEFGQPVLDIQDVVPGTQSHPDEKTVMSMRHE